MRAWPPVPRMLLALLFAISAANQFVQVPREFVGAEALPMLGVLHLAAALPGAAVAWGAWHAARWAWIAALAWGLCTATLILSLERLLALSPADAQGFVPAAITVCGLAALTAWYLRRAAARSAARATSPAATSAPESSSGNT